MRNQVKSAKKLGLEAKTINSSNKNEWDAIKNKILKNDVDLLLISPERLANENFMQDILKPISSNIGLFVVDEAHCIGDWGHDFRPDYKRIVRILKLIPSNTPILATTATANDRVIKDIEEQINGLVAIRGNLDRKTIALHNINLSQVSHKLAWLSEHLPSFEGSGIIYILTQRDAKVVCSWLNMNGISAKTYHSGVKSNEIKSSDDYREFLENEFIDNKIKVLVTTSALGIGFDKGDLGFIIKHQNLL